jgi:hypothetical protein
MQKRPIQMNEVIYNAADQCFEALVTVHDGDQSRRYDCSINAPISTSFADAARGLSKQAERRHMGNGGMFSEILRSQPPQRSGRPRFDPKAWLESVINHNGRRAA